MGNGYEYISAVVRYWWVLVPGGVLAVEPAIEYLWEGYSKWLDQYVSKEKRRRVILAISFLLIFYAGFLAWRDEHVKMEEASARVVKLQALLDARGESALQKELEATKTQLAELQKQVTPRRLGEEEKGDMVKALAASGSFSVTVSYLSDAESSAYALDFLSVLKRAAWQVSGPLLAMNSEPMPGVWIITRDQHEVPTGTRILMDVLKKHNIEVRQQKQNDPSLDPNSFVFLVGSKP